ncbi:MAG: hypothetical protein RMJ56_06115 [Gemmataceae bacterium]|nr:hypothetical protein [Gemmata sp.]MDW8197164.1 hypothetical protein [Gemmataceae bacterium]
MPKYPAAVEELLRVEHPVSLGPGQPREPLRSSIAEACSQLPPACAAGLWLRFDFLDEAHAISQADESDPERNFWHAILHRREPDAWNSKYWFRRVGHHPVLEQLRQAAPRVGYAYSSPEAFVDFCEHVRNSGSDAEATAQRVQQLEWDLLFAWCWEHPPRRRP